MPVNCIERVHIDTLEDDSIKSSQKFVLLSYLVPGFNMSSECTPGFIIRGVFPDKESAQAAFRKSKLKLNAVIAECGKPLIAAPTEKQMQDPELECVYSNSELQEILSSCSKKNRDLVDEFENHRLESKKIKKKISSRRKTISTDQVLKILSEQLKKDPLTQEASDKIIQTLKESIDAHREVTTSERLVILTV